MANSSRRARPRSSRRSGRRSIAAVLASALLVVGLGGLAVGAVVVVLRTFADSSQPTSECRAGSASLAPDQAANAALIVGVATQRGMAARAGTIGIATALQESWMRNIDFGDRDSLGLFQQRPSQGWGTPEQVMDPVYATGAFYDALALVPGYADLAITEAAQAVQRSGFPEAYAQHESVARPFASALAGWTPASLTCVLTARDGEAHLVPLAVADRLARDLGLDEGRWSVREGEGGAELVVEVGHDGDPAAARRLAWAVAHSAVAAAVDTGAGRVTLEGVTWARGAHAWEPLSPSTAGPEPGRVVISG